MTVGIEKEYQLLDPATLDLAPRFEDLAGTAEGLLAEAISGELIRSEIEIRTGRGENVGDAIADLKARRRLLFAHADAQGVTLARAGTHPWADWREQQIIDTDHYERVN